MRLLPALLAAAAIAVTTAAVGISAVPASAAVPTTCPSTFSVLHDDHIGSLQIPAGPYTVTVLDQSRLSCAEASDRFRQFLEDWDGVLPAPWTVNASTATFTAGQAVGFRIAPVRNPLPSGLYATKPMPNSRQVASVPLRSTSRDQSEYSVWSAAIG